MHPQGSFRIGSNAFWNYHKQTYNPKHFDEDAEYEKVDPQRAKKNSLTVNVKKKK